jgi:hypothetical protein
VAADGPPEGTGAPEAEAEDEAGEAGGDQSDGRFARILAVTKTEEDGQDERGGPVAKCLVMAGLEEPRIDAGDATGKSEEDLATSEVLLQKTDQEEAQEPDCAVPEGPSAEKEAAVEDEEAGFPKSENEKRKTGDSPKQAREHVGKHAPATETVDRVGALLDL